MIPWIRSLKSRVRTSVLLPAEPSGPPSLEVDWAMTTAHVSALHADIKNLCRKNVESLRELKFHLIQVGLAMDRLNFDESVGREVMHRLLKLAEATGETAKLALVASCAAAEQWDEEARNEAAAVADISGAVGRAAKGLHDRAATGILESFLRQQEGVNRTIVRGEISRSED